MYCSNCGTKLEESANFCLNCGYKVLHSVIHQGQAEVATTLAAEGYPSNLGRAREESHQVENSYAGFWERVGAAILDAILWILFSVFVAFLPIDQELYSLIGFFLAWMYYALLDSSSWQGTIGKKVMNIRVCDNNGDRISFLRASARYFLHLLSNITLLIGYIMVAFTDKKQALHDMASGCVVIRKNNKV